MIIVNIKYTAPLSAIDSLVGEHRAWLDIQYANGVLLCSGPKNPKTGGVVIALGSNKAEIEALFNDDPYNVNHVAEYTFTEFNPVKFHPQIKDLV